MHWNGFKPFQIRERKNKEEWIANLPNKFAIFSISRMLLLFWVWNSYKCVYRKDCYRKLSCNNNIKHGILYITIEILTDKSHVWRKWREKKHIRVHIINFEKFNWCNFSYNHEEIKWPKGIPLTKFTTGLEYVIELQSKFVRFRYVLQ